MTLFLSCSGGFLAIAMIFQMVRMAKALEDIAEETKEIRLRLPVDRRAAD